MGETLIYLTLDATTCFDIDEEISPVKASALGAGGRFPLDVSVFRRDGRILISCSGGSNRRIDAVEVEITMSDQRVVRWTNEVNAADYGETWEIQCEASAGRILVLE